MRIADTAYIDGAFVPTNGDVADIVNPATETVIGRVKLAGRVSAASSGFRSRTFLEPMSEIVAWARSLLVHPTRRKETSK